MTRRFEQERDEFEDVLARLTALGIRPDGDLRKATLLFLTVLHMPIYLDVHPRLSAQTAQAAAQRHRRVLYRAVLGGDPPGNVVTPCGTRGMDDVAVSDLPTLTRFGDTVNDAAIELLDEDGYPTIKIASLAEKLGVNVSRIYREMGDVVTIDGYSQVQSLMGVAIADIDTLRERPTPTSLDELRTLLHDILDGGFGAGRVSRRQRRLSALGASFGRSDLISLAAVHRDEATHEAMALIRPWQDALPLPTHGVATSPWAMEIPIGMERIDPMAGGYHDTLANFLVDGTYTDVVQRPPGPRRPATLEDAVIRLIRRGAIARAGATPMRRIDLATLTPEAGLTDLAAHDYFPTNDRLIDEAAAEAANRVLQVMRSREAPEVEDDASRVDDLPEILMTYRDAVALPRFLNISQRPSDDGGSRPSNRAVTRGRFVEGIGV